MSCIFCRIVSGEIPSKKVSENCNAIAFMDAFPLTQGHLIIIPKEHRERLQDMTNSDISDVFGLASKLVVRTDALSGSTLVAIHNGPYAGQVVPHVHIHLIPRYVGDGAGPIHSMFEKITPSEKDSVRVFERLRD